MSDKQERAYDAYPTRALNDERGERNKRRPAMLGREVQQGEVVLLVAETSKAAKEEVVIVD